MIVDLSSLVSWANSSIRLEVLLCFRCARTLRRIVIRQGVAAYTRMKNADWLDVVACAATEGIRQRPEMRAANQRRGSVCTLSTEVE